MVQERIAAAEVISTHALREEGDGAGLKLSMGRA